MAVIETWLMQDLKKPVPVQQLCGNFFSHNGNANRIGVRVYNGDSPATLSGTVSGYAVLTDGTTVPCTGSLSGNEASILLPAAAYVPGNIFITIMLTSGTTITTLAALAGNVVRARTDSQVDPGSVVTDWTNTINAALQTVENYTGNIIATPYASLTYPVPLGKYCIYNNLLYRCVSPIASSENWTASHWTQTKLADDVSDLKSAITFNDERTMGLFAEQLGVREYLEWRDGAIVTSGETVNIITPVKPSGSGTWKCLVVPCEAGDTFYVNIQNATSTYRPWAWVSANNAKISTASANAVNTYIVAPTDAAYLVCNVRTSSTQTYYVRKGHNPLPNHERFLESIVCDIVYDPDCFKGQVIDSSDGTTSTNARYVRTELYTGMPARNVIKLNNANYIMKASFYDSTGNTGGVGYLWSTQYIGDIIYLPPEAAKVGISVRRKDGADITDEDFIAIKSALSSQTITDVSLTKRGIPADAQSIGNFHREDIKGIYSEFGITWYPFTRGGAIRTDSATIDIETVADAPGWYYCVVPCSPGDVFHLSVWTATTGFRPWAFVASDGTRLSVANINRVDTNLTAPANAAYLVANANTIEKLKLTSGTIDYETVSALNERFYSRELLGIFRTIGVVGDSLSSGQGRINDLSHFHDFYEYSWPQQLKRRLGNEVYNFTESSLTTRSWLTDEDHGWALASDGNHTCQAYIIALGANDIKLIENNPSYLGQESDVHVSDYTQNPDTYYGNYARIISMLRTLEPRSIIFVLTNPSYGASSIRAQCNAAVEYMATAFDGVYCVQVDSALYNSGYIQANEVKSHYTPGAYLYMANYLMEAIGKIIHDNPSDFFFVNLIGTNYNTPVIT